MAFDRHRLAARAGIVLRPAAAATVALSACALSVGCGEKKAETTPEQEPTAALVTLDRSDGFSFDEHLVVLNSGSATVRFRYRPSEERGTKGFTLSQTKLDDLRTALEEADFSSLDSRYLASEGSEAVGYSVTYAGRKVAADEEAVKGGDVPEGLAHGLSLLNELLDSKLEHPQNS
jgi:hypothetical protein